LKRSKKVYGIGSNDKIAKQYAAEKKEGYPENNATGFRKFLLG
jgi:hypothetical protein